MVFDQNGYTWIPGAADAPTLDELLGPPPGGSSSSPGDASGSQIPVFRGGVESFDWFRLAFLALGLVIGWKVLR